MSVTFSRSWTSARRRSGWTCWRSSPWRWWPPASRSGECLRCGSSMPWEGWRDEDQGSRIRGVKGSSALMEQRSDGSKHGRCLENRYWLRRIVSLDPEPWPLNPCFCHEASVSLQFPQPARPTNDHRADRRGHGPGGVCLRGHPHVGRGAAAHPGGFRFLRQRHGHPQVLRTRKFKAPCRALRRRSSRRSRKSPAGPDGRPLAAREVVVLINLRKRGSISTSNVTIRGTSEASLALRPQVRMTAGRMPRPGLSEIMVGEGIAQRFQNAGQNETLAFANRDWTVVGVFDAGNTGFNSEIWGDAEQLMQAFRRHGLLLGDLPPAGPRGVCGRESAHRGRPAPVVGGQAGGHLLPGPVRGDGQFPAYPRHRRSPSSFPSAPSSAP